MTIRVFFVACEFVTFQEPFNTAIEIEEKKKNSKKHTEAALCELGANGANECFHSMNLDSQYQSAWNWNVMAS